MYGDPAAAGREGAVRRRPDARRWRGRPPSGAPTCWSCTTRCSSSRCTASRRPRRRAARSRTLAGAGCALLTAHTNADQAVGGVSEALADGARAAPTSRRSPRRRRRRLDKLTVFVPADARRRRCARRWPRPAPGGSATTTARRSRTPGRGPVPAARRARSPTIGAVGELEVVDEVRIEAVLPRGRGVRRSWRRCWPPTPTRSRRTTSSSSPTRGRRPTGAGRIGDGRARPRCASFAEAVAAALPETAHGVRVAGDPDRAVRRVAVCGGAGDFLLDTVLRTDADVYVTSDLRHHPAAEFLEQGGPALVDVAHWAAEWTWLPVVRGDGWRDGAGRYGGDPGEHDRAPTRGPSASDSATDRGAHAESRPVRPAEAARRPGARRPGRPAAAPAGEPARARRDRRARRPSAPSSTTRRRDAADRRRRPDRRAEEGRRRRRAGQGPAHPRPGPDGPGADHQPQGPRADAARAGVAGAPDRRARGRRARGDGAARGRPARRSTRCTAQARRGRRAAGRAGRAPRRAGRRRSTRSCAQVAAEREATADGLPADLLALYERLRAQKGGVGAAALRARQLRRLPARASTTPSSP